MTTRSRSPIGVVVSGTASITSTSSWVSVALGSEWSLRGQDELGGRVGADAPGPRAPGEEGPHRDQALGLGGPGERHPVGLSAQAHVTLVGLEDREGHVAGTDDPAQLGPGDEGGQIPAAVEHGHLASSVGAQPLQPVRDGGVEAVRVGRVAGDGDECVRGFAWGPDGAGSCAYVCDRTASSPSTRICAQTRPIGAPRRDSARRAGRRAVWSYRQRTRPIPTDMSSYSATWCSGRDDGGPSLRPENRPIADRSPFCPDRSASATRPIGPGPTDRRRSRASS